MNKAIISGNLVAAPEISLNATTGLKIARYRVAVNERVKGEVKTYFFPCVAFNSKADFAEKYFEKGKKVIVYGNIQIENYTDKDGIKRLSVSIVVDDVEFAEPKSSGRSELPPTEAASNDWMPVPDDVNDEGLPFN